jgi:hypothetical protein
VRVYFHAFYTSALHGDTYAASRFGRSTPQILNRGQSVHGDKDKVFPLAEIDPCLLVPGRTVLDHSPSFGRMK